MDNIIPIWRYVVSIVPTSVTAGIIMVIIILLAVTE